jgi:hypothetical protein
MRPIKRRIRTPRRAGQAWPLDDGQSQAQPHRKMTQEEDLNEITHQAVIARHGRHGGAFAASDGAGKRS